jgi:asparagine synthase (glutamine-hydrolysing)
MARLNAQFPESAKPRLSDLDWLEVERKRTFPFAYEQDLAQRIIPQRVMPWYVPMVDNDVIAAYLKMPPRVKLNSNIFRKMVVSVCPEKVRQIPDNNTRTSINASWPQYAIRRCLTSVQSRIKEKVMPQMATAGSWPNWQHYLRHSGKIESLWKRPNETAREIFTKILGSDPFEKSLNEYASGEIELFQRLLTQKLWLDQRTL